MPNKSQRGGKRGRKRKAETKPKPEKIPVQTQAKRGRKRGRKQKTDPEPPEMVDSSTSTTPAPVPSTSVDYEYKYSNILPLLAGPTDSEEDMFSRAYVKPTASLSDCLFADEDKSDIEIEVTEPETIDIRCCQNVSSDTLPLNTTTSFEESINNYIHPVRDDEREEASGQKEEMSQEEDNEEKVTEPTSRDSAKSPVAKNKNPSRRRRRRRRTTNPVSPSRRNRPTESHDAARLSDLERRIAEGQDVSIADIRFYRKMKITQVKRERKRTAFNPHMHYHSFWAMIKTDTRISLDRYQYDKYSKTEYDYLNSFRTRILGSKEKYFCTLSPYSKRILKPFIMRDNETTPLWLRMMDELQRKANKKNPTWEPPQRAPIDYCYVRPHHLPAMNSLAELYFWPGINLRECLHCPDFSCVVFYKKLLIGFIIAFPNFPGNDIYIAFMVVRREWQSSGIGSLMLYHVIESTNGRDLTLHVSPTNPALILYQKFGFKVLCFEKHFYSRYLPPDSKQCRHAFYMKSKDFPRK